MGVFSQNALYHESAVYSGINSFTETFFGFNVEHEIVCSVVSYFIRYHTVFIHYRFPYGIDVFSVYIERKRRGELTRRNVNKLRISGLAVVGNFSVVNPAVYRIAAAERKRRYFYCVVPPVIVYQRGIVFIYIRSLPRSVRFPVDKTVGVYEHRGSAKTYIRIFEFR